MREDALAEFKTNLLQQNLKIIQSLLLLQLPGMIIVYILYYFITIKNFKTMFLIVLLHKKGVQEKLKKQIKEVELAQSKEVSLHWPGMAEVCVITIQKIIFFLYIFLNLLFKFS